ncbi:MAG: response regulator transcription factor [Synechococcales cyanobacterium RM1_1_8]|nr:response regulator transcription factor [Synechococcales cyanobacterium RM1_1_8]
MDQKIRVVLVEDHDLTRMGLRAALSQFEDMNFLGEAANGEQGLEMLKVYKPDVALVDIGLPDIDGIELVKQFREFQAGNETGTRIVMLTMHDSEKAVLAAFAAGADSYCTKEIATDHLVEAIRETNQGQAWIDPAIARIVLGQVRPQPTPVGMVTTERTVAIRAVDSDYEQIIESYPLTERELEILENIVNGCSNAQVAERLYITVGTVKTHVRNILNKLGASDRTQAAVRALRAGLIS